MIFNERNIYKIFLLLLAVLAIILIPTVAMAEESEPDDVMEAVPTIGRLAFSETSPTNKENFTIRARSVSAASGEIANVKFRVWRDGASKSTKQVYTGRGDGLGNWSMTFKMSNFDYTPGLYHVTVYATDEAGNTASKTGSIEVSTDRTPPTMESINFSGQPETTIATSFNIRATGVTDDAGIKKVKFTIWRNGAASSTKKTVEGRVAKNGDWYTSFNIDKYGGKTGLYKVTVSAEDILGNFAVLQSSEIRIVEEDYFNPPSMEGISFSEKDPTTATKFTISALGVHSDAGIKSVTFRVWRDGGGKTRSLAATDAGNGTYSAEFNLDSFGGEYGKYKVYVYGEDIFGRKIVMAISSITVEKTASKQEGEEILVEEGDAESAAIDLPPQEEPITEAAPEAIEETAPEAIEETTPEAIEETTPETIEETTPEMPLEETAA